MNLVAETSRTAALLPRARSARILIILLALVGTLTLFSASALAAEEETHVFDATLSLTGSCTVNTFDPVPDPGCPDNHAPKAFAKNAGVAVDPYGNRYVASAGGNPAGTGGRIDVFDSSGEFVTGFPVTPLPEYNVSIAVDSQGYLYVSRGAAGEGVPNLLRYAPVGTYNPAAGEIDYGPSPTPFAVQNPKQENGEWPGGLRPVAINPEDDHLFVSYQHSVWELGSAAEGNPFVETIVDSGLFSMANAIALDAERGRLYVSAPDKSPTEGGSRSVVKVFDLEEAPNKLLFEIDGSTTPTSRFVSETRLLPIAIDEATGHVFVGDLNASPRRVYEFDAAGDPVSTIAPPGGFEGTETFLAQMAYDDSPTSPTKDYLFVPSHSGPGRSLAFAPKPETAPPVVEELSVTGITSGEAILRGKVNPNGLETSYRIEYTTAQDEEFEEAALAGEGSLKSSGEGQPVSAYIGDLAPATSYRFRIVAENEEGEGEAESTFLTYAEPEISSDCPNQALRTGPSASLPDCRAYELVTPSNTNGHPPFGGDSLGPVFPAPLASPAGEALSFTADGGVIPGAEGVGGLQGDPYLSIRGSDGWHTEGAGTTGPFAENIAPGSAAPDQLYSVWLTGGDVPSALEGKLTTYLRFPDGHSEPLGKGSLATKPEVGVRLITAGASHAIFDSSDGTALDPPRQLEPNAPPDGTAAIYDRTADGTLHVVSFLPGEITPGAGQDAVFKGASFDGEGVAFEIGGTLYLRHRNEATYTIGTGLTFAGMAEGGERLFYLQGGDLYRFDAQDESTTPFSASGDVTVVNVAADGTAAYLISPSVLDGAANPEGKVAQAGEENLWLSREGQISFVATVSQRDVEGVYYAPTNSVRGLGLWTSALLGYKGALGMVPARTTPDGGALLFESNAPLTEYDPEGHTQVYRYDADGGTLDCLSCIPTESPATGDASLQTFASAGLGYLSPWNLTANLRQDGNRALFESTEALVLDDTDGLKDVYEWEAQGVGSCEAPSGCVHLLTSGQSGDEELLYAVSESGGDVFFRSSGLLAGDDTDETPSIYDARVNGGFPPPSASAGECLGEACQPAAVAPNDPTPGSSNFQGAGNVKDEKTSRGRKSCPKGKRVVRRSGKSHCVSRKGKKQGKQAKGNRRAGR